MKCKYCKEPATNGVIWADGRARIAVCDVHLSRAKKKVASNNDQVDKVTKMSEADRLIDRYLDRQLSTDYYKR